MGTWPPRWNSNGTSRFAANLETLGFRNYAEYLKSALWRDIREQVLRPWTNCAACHRNSASQVHHRRYSIEVLRGDDISQLVPLCVHCHTQIEYDDNGKKRKLVDANTELDRRIRRYGY